MFGFNRSRVLALLGVLLATAFEVGAQDASSIKVRATTFQLQNYQIENQSQWGSVIRVTAAEGRATYNFTGVAGAYSMIVEYVDEKDGQGEFDIRKNSATVVEIQNNKDTDTIQKKTVTGLTLRAGDQIQIVGYRSLGENARVVSLEFVREATVPAQADYKILPGDFVRSGYSIESATEWGGPLLRLTQSQGNAKHTFSGPSGYYDLVLRHVDETDGAGQVSVQVEGTTLATFLNNKSISGDSSAKQVRSSVILGVRLSTGDEIAVYGVMNSGENARFFGIDLTKTVTEENNETPPPATPTPAPTPTPVPTPAPAGNNSFPASVSKSGYTTLRPSSDSKIIYVSSSMGSDSNDGLSPSKPLLTPSVAFTKIRSGYPDWIVFKSGDEWNRKIAHLGSIKGRSASEPVVISRYGSGSRPRFNFGGDTAFRAHGTISHFVMEGLHLKGDAFTNSSITHSIVFDVRIGAGENITIENCFFEKSNEGILVSDSSSYYKNVTLRRNIIVDMTPRSSGWGGRVSGIYASKVQGLNLIENVFDNNGYNSNKPANYRTVFSHNAYIADTVSGLVAKGNIFARGSSDGLKMRRGGLAEDNFFIQNAVAVSINDYKFAGVTTTVRDNVMVDGSTDYLWDYGSTPQIRNYGFWAPYVKDSTIVDERNIFAHSDVAAQGSKAFADQGSTQRNTIYNWGKSTNTSASFTDPNRTIEKYHQDVLNGRGDKVAFFAEMRQQSRENYKPEYSATKINDYFQAGFQRR